MGETILLVGCVIFGCALWLVVYAYLMWTLRQLPRLHLQAANLVSPTRGRSFGLLFLYTTRTAQQIKF